ncbi:hypothetical protein SBADM41S_03139 [Streptomyces badius]
MTARHEEAKRALAEAQAAHSTARDEATAAERRRAAVAARHEALASGSAARTARVRCSAPGYRLTGLLGWPPNC